MRENLRYVSILEAIQNILMMELCETREICVGWVLRATLLCSHKLNPDVFLQAKTRDVVIPRKPKCSFWSQSTTTCVTQWMCRAPCWLPSQNLVLRIKTQHTSTLSLLQHVERKSKVAQFAKTRRETTFLETFSAEILGDNAIDVRVTAYHQSSGGSFADTHR